MVHGCTGAAQARDGRERPTDSIGRKRPPQVIPPGHYLSVRPGWVLIAGTVCGKDAASERPRDGRKARPGGQCPPRPHGHVMPHFNTRSGHSDVMPH